MRCGCSISISLVVADTYLAPMGVVTVGGNLSRPSPMALSIPQPAGPSALAVLGHDLDEVAAHQRSVPGAHRPVYELGRARRGVVVVDPGALRHLLSRPDFSAGLEFVSAGVAAGAAANAARASKGGAVELGLPLSLTPHLGLDRVPLGQRPDKPLDGEHG